MNARKAVTNAIAVGLLTLTVGFLQAQEQQQKAQPPANEAAEAAAIEKRSQIDAVADEALEDLFAGNETAQTLYDQAAGYAVFRATKAGLVLTGAGGSGVAVNRKTGNRTYMRMGSGGVGLGAGIQNYRLVILFETETALDSFTDGGWDAATSAQAAAGKAGVNAASSFVDGIAIYQLTDKGLMAQADLTGTRFWAADKLNKP